MLDVARRSLSKRALEEARAHRWIESEKAGRDLGDAAVHDWSNRYWPSFWRHCWVEHLEGRHYWEEFGEQHFGMAERFCMSVSRDLVQRILERVRRGGENLDIIQWATDTELDMAAVLRVLEQIDINSQRELRARQHPGCGC